MTSDRLGQRYERLLILAAPLFLLAIFLLDATTAAITAVSPASQCYNIAANAIEADKGNLSVAVSVDEYLNSKTRPVRPINTFHALVDSDIFMALEKFNRTDCTGLVEKFSNEYRNPGDLVKALRGQASLFSKLKANSPIDIFGVEVSKNLKTVIFGIPAEINLLDFSRAAALAAGPIILLWLSSLYQTRVREIMLTIGAPRITDVYPHAVNIYPLGRLPELRRRSWVKYFLIKSIYHIYFVLRVIFLLAFIAPPTGVYLLVVYYYVNNSTGAFSFVMLSFGLLVALAFSSNLIIEVLQVVKAKKFAI